MTVQITDVLDAGDDVLLVRAVDADGNELEATGWVSATTNHYAPSAYSKDAETDELVRDAKVEPRAMTPAEVGEYAKRLMLEQHPELDATAQTKAAPVAIAFVEPPPFGELEEPA
jgi:hypothetical protein